VGAQPCRILKHRPDLLKDLQAQQGRGLGNDETTDRAAAILQRLGSISGRSRPPAFGEIKPHSGSLKEGWLDLVYYQTPALI
jgi:hypothetical protein